MSEPAASQGGDHPGHAAAAELHLAVVHGDDARRASSIRAATCRGSRRPRQQAGVTIEKILLTHGHIDHCGSAGILAEELGVPIEGPHEDDRFWIDRLAEDGAKYGIAGRPFEPSRWLDRRRPGDASANSPSTSATAPATRPATSSSTIRESKLALVGDVLFRGSVGRWDFPHGDQQQLIRSITDAAVADGRRDRVRAGPRPDVDLRPRAPDQSVRRRCGARGRLEGRDGGS